MITADRTSTFPRFLDLGYPSIERGDGVWLYTDSGGKILDACSGGAMVSNLGHVAHAVVDAGARQAEEIAYMYMDHFTNQPQEDLAARLLEVAAPEMARVRFASSGSEANETALRLARQYHVDRGEADRWQVISFAQAYHGSTMATLALSGRAHTLQAPYGPYLSRHLHISPSLRELDEQLEQADPGTIAAFFCEPVGAAARPAYSPPDEFWRGLAERREKHGFVVCFDEVVTGMGRLGTWFAYQQLPIEPDIVTVGKGLGAGYAAISAVLCKQHVYDAIAAGSRSFDLGHTLDGAPLSCATALAVIDALVDERMVERVRDRGPRLLEQLKQALAGISIVGEVRGRGFLLGFDLLDPRDGSSFLPAHLDVAHRTEDVALDHGLLIGSTQSTSDGYAGDQILLAPPFVSSDAELDEMVSRTAAVMREVDAWVSKSL